MSSVTSNKELIADIKNRYSKTGAFANYYCYRLEKAGVDFPITAIKAILTLVPLGIAKDTYRTRDNTTRLYVGFTINHARLFTYHKERFKDQIQKPSLKSSYTVKMPRKSCFPVHFWWVPPIFFDLDTGESGFVDGVAMFNFPVHPTNIHKDTATIDDVYYFNSSRLAQFMLTMPDLDRVENMEYSIEPIAISSTDNLNRIKNFYLQSEHVVEKLKKYSSNGYNCMNFFFPTIINTKQQFNKFRWFTITRGERILAVLTWTSFAGKIYIPFIRVVSKLKFDDELQPYLFHLIIYEFSKRLPRDTELIVAGSSSDPVTFNRFKVLQCENYKVIPTVPRAIQTDSKNNRRQEVHDLIMNLDIKGYIPENFLEPYLKVSTSDYKGTDLLYKPIFRLFNRLANGLNLAGALKRFRRYAIKHNAKVVAKCYRKRTAKSYKHYIQLSRERAKYIGGDTFTSFKKNRELIYGNKKIKIKFE